MQFMPLIIAHRGASAYLPENTLAAFRLAFERFKADMIEFDVRAARDGEPVVIHDARLERTTSGKGYVSEHTLKELKAGFSNAIPALDEVFAALPGRRFAIEIKEKSKELVHSVMTLVKKYRAEGEVIVGSKYDLVAKELRKSYPSVRRFASQKEIMALCLEARRGSKPPEQDPLGVVSVPPSGKFGSRLDTPVFMDHVHRKGMKIFFWTVNDPLVMKALAEKGADGIVTDDPGLAHRIIKK